MKGVYMMKLNQIFTSHMVFASGLPIRIYGTGAGEAEIVFAGKTKRVISHEDEWLAEFPPMAYGGPYELVFTSAGETVVLEDIYVGEVYVFAGQSNMQIKMESASTEEALYEGHEKLRLFSTTAGFPL